MKKIFLFLAVITASVVCFSQGSPYPNFQRQGNVQTRWYQEGAVHAGKGLINGVYPDTIFANAGYQDFYPGAQIITTTGGLKLWLRDNPAYRWINVTNNVVSFTFNTDSSLTICYGNGVCETIAINNFSTVVNNLIQNFIDNSIFQDNDSTLIICPVAGSCDTIHLGNSNTYNITYDSTTNSFFLVTCDTLQSICISGTSIGDSCYQQQVCDTIPVNRPIIYQFQNGLRQIPNTPLIELGNPFPGEGGKNLYRNTWLYASPGYLTVEGKLLAHEPFAVEQHMILEESPSIQSWNHIGRGYSAGIDNPNTVNLYMNYTDPFYNDSSGFVFDRIGYLLNTNGRGGRYSLSIDNVSSKQSGILYHTLDTANTDAVTIFGTQVPKSMAFPNTPAPTSTFYEDRIAVFKTDLSTNFLGKVYLTNGRLEPDTALIVAANNLTLGLGNVFLVSGATQINAITISGWQAGSSPIYLVFSGAPLVKNNTAGGAGTATILLAGRTDFQAAAGDVLSLLYDGINWYETNRSLAAAVASANANNGNSLSGSYVQLGQSIAAVGNPAILLSNREIPMANFTLNLNADAAQSNNIFVTKNAAAAIRARITSAADFSNTGGQSSAEKFGDGAVVGGANSMAMGNGANAGASNSISIGTNSASGTGGINMVVGTGTTNGNGIQGNTLLGNSITHTTSGNATLVGASISSTGRSTGVGNSGTYSASNNFGFGEQVVIAHNYSGGIGFGATTTATNQLVFGASINSGSEGGIDHIFWGEGVTSVAPDDIDLNPNGGSGTNVGGSSFYINGSKATGNAAGGSIYLGTSDAGSSGSTLQTLTNKAVMYYTGVFGIGKLSAFTGSRLEVDDDNLATTMAYFSSTNTTAASGQKLVHALLDGANATSGRTTYTGYYENNHTGTSSANYALAGIATNGSSNYGVYGSGGTYGVLGSSNGTSGVYGENTSNGSGVTGVSTGGSGQGGVFTSQGSSANNILATIHAERTYSGTVTAGVGTAIDFRVQSDDGFRYQSARIASTWTDVTTGTRTGDFEIFTTNSASSTLKLTITGAGIFILSQGLQDFADDAAAAAGSIPIGGLYRTASVVKIRVS